MLDSVVGTVVGGLILTLVSSLGILFIRSWRSWLRKQLGITKNSNDLAKLNARVADVENKYYEQMLDNAGLRVKLLEHKLDEYHGDVH